MECCKHRLDFDSESQNFSILIYEVPAQHKLHGSSCPVEVSLCILVFWNISITRNHGILTESPCVNSFLVTTAVYYYPVQHGNGSSLFSTHNKLQHGCRWWSFAAPYFGGLLCSWCFGDQSWGGERHLLSPSAACDSQCLCSCFQQNWAHPCLLYCSACFNLLNLSMAFCLVASSGNVVSSGREGCQAAFLWLFAVKP